MASPRAARACNRTVRRNINKNPANPRFRPVRPFTKSSRLLTPPVQIKRASTLKSAALRKFRLQPENALAMIHAASFGHRGAIRKTKEHCRKCRYCTRRILKMKSTPKPLWLRARAALITTHFQRTQSEFQIDRDVIGFYFQFSFLQRFMEENTSHCVGNLKWAGKESKLIQNFWYKQLERNYDPGKEHFPLELSGVIIGFICEKNEN